MDDGRESPMDWTVDFEAETKPFTGDLSLFYEFGAFAQQHLAQLDMANYSTDLFFKNLEGSVSAEFLTSVLQHAIDEILARMIADFNIPSPVEKMIFSIKLTHRGLMQLSKKSVYLPPRSYEQNSARALFAMINKVTQSSEDITIGEGLRISITARPEGLRGGDDEIDRLCMLRAFIRGYVTLCFETLKERLRTRSKFARTNYHKLKCYKKKHKEWVSVMNDDALALHYGEEFVASVNAGTIHPEVMMGLDDLQKLECGMFGMFRLFVYHKRSGCVLYSSWQSNTKPILALLFDPTKRHYELFPSNKRSLFGGRLRHYCKYCGHFFTNPGMHQVCKHKCLYCQRNTVCDRKHDEETTCLNCKITFPSTQCFNNHFVNGRCTARRYRCLDCERTFFCNPVRMEQHRSKCGKAHYCIRCNDYVESPTHVCSWKPVTLQIKREIRDALDSFRYAFFDFETRVNEIVDGEIEWCEKQTVTHCVIILKCNKCCPEQYKPNWRWDLEGDEENRRTTDDNTECDCPREPIIFSELDGENVLQQVGDYIFFEKCMNKRTCFAHNAARFDTHFLLDYLLVTDIDPEIISNGQSIIMLKVGENRDEAPRRRKRRHQDSGDQPNVQEIPRRLIDVCATVRHLNRVINKIKVLDTCLFVPIALSKFAGSFGLQDGKGQFPIFANTQYFKTRFDWPDPKFFNADNRPVKERAEIIKFVEEKRAAGEVFVLEHEIVKYCLQDVEVLMKGALQFRKTFIEAALIDPFKSVTLASACLQVFRIHHNNFDITATPENGYNANHNYSKISIRWLEWEAKKRGVQIRHAESGGEVEVLGKSGKKYRVDGYYEKDEEKHVLEFFGCLFHHHIVCLGEDYEEMVLGKQWGTAYTETLERVADLEAAGFFVTSVWECEVHHLLKTNLDMKEFFDNTPVYGPLRPRDAMKGARTGCCNLLLKAKPGRELVYYDIKSLYPYIQCTTEYALGPPTVYNRPSLDDVFSIEEKLVETYVNGVRNDVLKRVQVLKHRGLYYCTVVPPRDQYIALLPIRHEKMLFYTLCHKCMVKYTTRNVNVPQCIHTDEERALTDTWYGDELQLALDHGYRITYVHEFWAWDRFSPKGDSLIDRNTLFGSYFQTFFKLKEENSGFPRNDMNEEEKGEFIDQFERAHGIRLDRERLENPNKSLRFVCKLMCNSLWGRFAMRIRRTNHTFVRTRQDADKFWCDPTKIIKNDMMMPDSKIWCFVWENAQEALHSADYGSLIIGIITLSLARVKLTKLMLEVEGTGPLRREQPIVSYYDTDSLILKIDTPEERETVERFLSRNVGDQLGALTNEIADGWRGVELIAPGAKQYHLQLQNDEGEFDALTKLRGVTQNYSTRDLITREALEAHTIALQEERQEEIDPIKLHMVRIRKNMGQISNVEMVKQYYARNCKGILKDYVSYPFGYSL